MHFNNAPRALGTAQVEFHTYGFAAVREVDGGGGRLRARAFHIHAIGGDVPILRVDEGITIERWYFLAFCRLSAIFENAISKRGRKETSHLRRFSERYAASLFADVAAVDTINEALRTCISRRGDEGKTE